MKTVSGMVYIAYEMGTYIFIPMANIHNGIDMCNHFFFLFQVVALGHHCQILENAFPEIASGFLAKLKRQI